MSPEEDRTHDAVDSEPKHYQLSYSGPGRCHSTNFSHRTTYPEVVGLIPESLPLLSLMASGTVVCLSLSFYRLQSTLAQIITVLTNITEQYSVLPSPPPLPKKAHKNNPQTTCQQQNPQQAQKRQNTPTNQQKTNPN